MTDEANKVEEVGTVEVIAIQRGHDGVRVREEGEVFHVPKGRLKDGSSWFEPLSKHTEKPAPAKPTSKVPPGAGPLPK